MDSEKTETPHAQLAEIVSAYESGYGAALLHIRHLLFAALLSYVAFSLLWRFSQWDD